MEWVQLAKEVPMVAVAFFILWRIEPLLRGVADALNGLKTEVALLREAGAPEKKP